MIDYTAEQMAKMIVLAETLLRFKAIKPIKFLPAVQVGFRSYAEASIFELALEDTRVALRQSGTTPSRVYTTGSKQ